MKNTIAPQSLLFRSLLGLLAISMAFSTGMSQSKKRKKGKHGTEACCTPSSEGGETMKLGEVSVSNFSLTNQDGQIVKLYDLIKGKVVAMNFIFTTCTTICPPMGANFAELNRRMASVRGDNLAMISVSIDPGNDNPERLKAWSEKFAPGPGWTLLTGDVQTVNQLLKELKVFTPLKNDHAPILLIGKQGEDNWIRTSGLAEADLIESTVKKYLGVEAGANPVQSTGDQGSIDQPESGDEMLSPAQQNDLNYFTDTRLVDQTGQEFRLYSDLMKDKVVIINPFFAECTGSCPVMHKMMQEVQIWLGDRLGSEVVMLSLTVDPKNDTPEKLREYAKAYEAKPGWHFLSGEVENVETVTRKLGKYVEEREAHDTVILIGNLKTKLWKKANGLADPMEIIAVIKSVVEDEG